MKRDNIRILSQLFQAGAISWKEVRKAIGFAFDPFDEIGEPLQPLSPDFANNAPERPEQITPQVPGTTGAAAPTWVSGTYTYDPVSGLEDPHNVGEAYVEPVKAEPVLLEQDLKRKIKL